MDDPTTRRITRPAASADLPLLGGRYLREQEIAHGGMATVYLGRDTVLERQVAIKVLRPEAERQGEEAFLREARAAAALQHPNIVDVYDAGVEGDLPYIVMEYVPGETLRDLIAREGPLPPSRAALLAARLADALGYAHRHGVVHCDIKPGNVLLPDGDEPKIVDFGIAHAANTTAALTETISGTAGYISPEQIEGVPPDGRADVYSLAAVLYEMLTGVPPFEGRTLAAVVSQKSARPPLPPSERNPAVPPTLSMIVMRGLERDRERRYPSAGEFAIALRLFADGMTQQATRRMAPRSRTHEAPTRRIADPTEGRTRAIAAPAPALPVPRRGGFPWTWLAGLGALLAVAVAAAVVFAAGLVGGGGGAASVTAPDVVNRPLNLAADEVHRVGLNVGDPIEFTAAQQPFGTVIAQDPPQGTRLPKQAAVRLKVSLGPPS